MALRPILKPNAAWLTGAPSASPVEAKDLIMAGGLPRYMQMLPTPTNPGGANWTGAGGAVTTPGQADPHGGTTAFKLATAGSAETYRAVSAYFAGARVPKTNRWHTFGGKLKLEGAADYFTVLQARLNAGTVLGTLKIRKADGDVYTAQTGLSSATFAAGVAIAAYDVGTWISWFLAVRGLWASPALWIKPAGGLVAAGYATDTDDVAGDATFADLFFADGLYPGDPPQWVDADDAFVPLGGDLGYAVQDKAAFRRMPYASGSFTLDDSYYGAVIETTGGTAFNITVPATLKPGFFCDVIQCGNGAPSFVASGVTIRRPSAATANTPREKYSRVSLVQLANAANEYSLTGDLVTT